MSYGGVIKVVPRDQLTQTALSLADELAAKSPPAMRLMKEVANLIETASVEDGYHIEQFGTAILSGMPESKEAATALREKRKPNFDDLQG